MGGENIYIDLPAMEIKIQKLKQQRDNMKTALDGIRDDILKLPETWNGNRGDRCYEKLIRYSARFKEIIDKMDEYISHLESVKKSYLASDKAIENRLEENANISAA